MSIRHNNSTSLFSAMYALGFRRRHFCISPSESCNDKKRDDTAKETADIFAQETADIFAQNFSKTLSVRNVRAVSEDAEEVGTFVRIGLNFSFHR